MRNSEYDYGTLYETGSATASTGVSSAFRSALPLGGHVRKSTTPGVGEYDAHTYERTASAPLLRSAHNYSKDGSSMFASSSQRRSLADTTRTDERVGPGAYDLERCSIKENLETSTNPRLPGFLSSTQRSMERARARSPAPGTYDDFARETLSARSARSFRTRASSGEASFNTSATRRTAMVSADAGDPGAYEVGA